MLRKYLFLLAATAVLLLQTLSAEHFEPCTHTTGKTSDNYFGVGRLQLASTLFDDNNAISLMGELGPKSYRGSGTLGTFYECHRVKVGGEYLGQKMSYNFCTGQEKHWVHQYAVGGRYECVLGCDWLTAVYIDGSSSYADSKKLGTIEFVQTSIANNIETIVDTKVQRHLAGARYYNVQIGGQFIPWDCSNFLVGVGFNDVRYNEIFHRKHKNQGGVSVDLEFVQRFCDNIILDLTAQFRRPYTYAEALIDWKYDTGCGVFSLGLFGGYVWGKDKLPNSTNAGVQLGFSFGPSCCTSTSCCPTTSSYCGNYSICSLGCEQLIAWVNKPAVYMPTVLAIPEQCVQVTTTQIQLCTAPIFSGTIEDQSQTVDIPLIVPTSGNFSGSGPLTFTITNAYCPTPIIVASCDPNTGICTFNSSTVGSCTYFVTATNSCGSAETNQFNITFNEG